jgi:hypothetical protein
MITKNPNREIFPWDTTPWLGGSVTPQPKKYKEKKNQKPVKKIGKQTEANMEATKGLMQTAVKLGITTCEVKLDGCWKGIQGFAHGKKKRKLTPIELKKFAIGSCNPCHDKIEYDCEKWTGMTMEQFVRMTIRNRKK